ncbi:hypothetical protein [Motilibacter deserti]|uniref:Uncharacterized protein n=1 Tax=Motilibacter deserti TaxID=2714956 RepID=A0ABX0GW91_9ACTN|nr:hypothetical protein [Motilibacter deserti]NHC13533.1 hypothetical protein [Motilibacter deserti]
MAKALFGHVGGPDARILGEVRQLRERVRDLESQVLRLQNEKDALAEMIEQGALLAPSTGLESLESAEKEPALA